MKLASLATVAAALVAPATLVAAAPRVVQVHPSDIKVRNVGGSSFKLPQIHNDMFQQHGKGPRALAKVYEKYNMELPPNLRAVVRKILQELGIKIPHASGKGAQVIGGAPYTNETDDQGALSSRRVYCFEMLTLPQARFLPSPSSSMSSIWLPSRSARRLRR